MSSWQHRLNNSIAKPSAVRDKLTPVKSPDNKSRPHTPHTELRARSDVPSAMTLAITPAHTTVFLFLVLAVLVAATSQVSQGICALASATQRLLTERPTCPCKHKLS